VYSFPLSRRGASFNLLKRLGSGEFEINLSVPLCFEYESIAKRIAIEKQLLLTEKDIEELLEKIMNQSANLWEIYFFTRFT
jgi:hypothetical protein